MASKTEQILIEIAEIKKDTGNIFRRLDRINGSIEDYPVSKDRLSEACKDLDKLKDKISNKIEPRITNIWLKFYTICGAISLISAGIGAAIGAAIVRASLGG